MTRDITNESFVIERTFEAPLERTFRAFSEEEAKKAWYFCDDAMELIEYSLDFRPGGAEVNRLRPPGGEEHRFLGRFLDIVDRERIVYAYTMDVGAVRLSASLATMEFRAEGKRTGLKFTEQVAFLDGPHDLQDRILGTELGFDMLARVLPGLG
jgi:uncharacterized protein YndB with AHSA1/START domain